MPDRPNARITAHVAKPRARREDFGVRAARVEVGIHQRPTDAVAEIDELRPAPDAEEVAEDVTVELGGSAVTVEEVCEDIVEASLFDRLSCGRCADDQAADERQSARRYRRTQQFGIHVPAPLRIRPRMLWVIYRGRRVLRQGNSDPSERQGR
jgi:hypothetical protein